MSHGTERPHTATHSGRHRHGGAGTWTPSVPSQSREGRHETPELTHPPAEQSNEGNTQGRIAGVLPVPGAEATGGELPIPEQGEPSQAPEVPASRSGAQPKRTRVTFTRPEQAPVEPADVASSPTQQPEDSGEQQDDPPEHGLGMFDLGSVPASVTPPRTWRKAAWFAAGSSGGVMGLLFVGTFLIGQQPSAPQAVGEWTYLNRRDGAPLLQRDDLLGRPTEPPAPRPSDPRDSDPRDSSAPTENPRSSSDAETTEQARGQAPPQDTRASGTSTPGSGGATTTAHRTSEPTTPPSTPPPEKPPPTPAPSTVVNEEPVPLAARQASEMSKRSQEFLNTVTERPKEAHELTTGELHDKGAQGLRRKYSEVAYFEVKKVVVNEGDGVTTSTVRTVYKDGHAETEKVTMTFDRNGKIASASR